MEKTIEKNNAVLETPYIKLWINSGILYCSYRSETYLDLNIARDCVEKRIEFTQGVSYPCCVFLKNIKSANKDARKYFADEGNVLLKASALISESPLTTALGNFFLNINKQEIPVRLFTDEKKAEKWLRIFV
jgi:hypothetical protein